MTRIGQHRRADLRWAARRYRRAECQSGVCVYCGAVAGTEDHVPPISILAERGIEWFVAQSIPLLTFPACRDCNGGLHHKQLFTLRDRCCFLAIRLRERHGRLLSMPDWSDDDLKQMGYALRTKIKNALEQKRFVLRRLAILEDV